MKKINGIIMQYFEWYMDCKQNLWNDICGKAQKLSELGITALWLPPAYKGIGGKDEVGYGAYDLYDLGEFDQKGTVKTKYGSKDEYLNCIMNLKQNGIEKAKIHLEKMKAENWHNGFYNDLKQIVDAYELVETGLPELKKAMFSNSKDLDYVKNWILTVSDKLMTEKGTRLKQAINHVEQYQ